LIKDTSQYVTCPNSISRIFSEAPDFEHGCELLAMVVEPLPTLAVGEEAMTRGALWRALELGLMIEIK